MPSFDIVSKVQWAEVENALNQASKEIGQRYDFKDTGTEIERNDDGILIRSSSEDRAEAAYGVLQEKLVKRKVSLKHFDAGEPEASGKTTKMLVKIKEGIEAENAKKIVMAIKDAKLKVQAAIQGDQLRVTGKNKDDLQQAIQLVRGIDLPFETQFINFRD
ncbi:MAG TPA: YajQ family cyclic di-GMP-binding protein [Polyangiaceae bacterium]